MLASAAVFSCFALVGVTPGRIIFTDLFDFLEDDKGALLAWSVELFFSTDFLGVVTDRFELASVTAAVVG